MVTRVTPQVTENQDNQEIHMVQGEIRGKVLLLMETLEMVEALLAVGVLLVVEVLLEEALLTVMTQTVTGYPQSILGRVSYQEEVSIVAGTRKQETKEETLNKL